MSQPQWKCVANLGDVDPMEHGGLLVFIDETGEYPPEVEKIEPDVNGKWQVHRALLEPCTFIDGVLSDNPFHPDYPAWFADDLASVCSTMDVELDDLIRMFCSDDAVERAEGWRCVADYWGWENMDQYPLTLTRSEVEQRLKRNGIPEVLAR